MTVYKHQTDFTLENGTVLPGIEIAYTTYGQLNAAKSNGRMAIPWAVAWIVATPSAIPCPS